MCRSTLQIERGTTHRSFPTRKGEKYMKATGIVRRVDDLGRIVIPKEIRRTLRIREGDPSRTTFTSEEQFKRAITNIYIWCRDRGLCE